MKIIIRYDESYDEYRVPGPDGTDEQIYFTSDEEDAIDTAKVIFGKDVEIAILPYTGD